VQRLSDRIVFNDKNESIKEELHMAQYTHLKEIERIRIFDGLKRGASRAEIAALIGRHKSNISREIKRNSDQHGYLYPKDAQKKAEGRKARHGTKISRNLDLKNAVIAKLKQGHAPDAIAGRSKIEKIGGKSISREAIYGFIYHEENRSLGLHKLLPRKKNKRGMVARKKRETGGILHRVSIHERPKEIESRKEFGHFEADLMFNKGSQSANVLTTIERTSRRICLVKHNSKKSDRIIKSVKKAIGSEAKSCTFDNGKEFALHHKLKKTRTFFCDPGKPWQKGSVEKANGMLRRYLPFSLRAQDITQKLLDQVADTINNIPRKSLGYLTPAEVFEQNKKLVRRVGMKPALPAVEALFYQKSTSVALRY
jgi:IS30 family transposase